MVGLEVVMAGSVALLTGVLTLLTLIVLCSGSEGPPTQLTIKVKKQKRKKPRPARPKPLPPDCALVRSEPLPPLLHSPCSGCGQVNAKQGCRYTSCGSCCRARENSACPAHGTAYKTAVHATETAISFTYTEFDISYSFLKCCPPQITQIGPQLVSLNLSNNCIHTLPEDLGRLSSLIELFLQYNQLSALPESICLLTQLEELDAKNNCLTRLPECLGHIKNLFVLNLTNNRLKSLPVSIGALTRLEELSLHGNQLSSLPPELCSLRRLRALYAGENPLCSLPDEFGSLVSLEELDLSDGLLVTLPQSLSDCRHLVRAWLSGNRFKCLPHHFGKLRCLKELHLRNNRITHFPSSIEQLDLFTFTAQANCLMSEREARNKTRPLHCKVPPLLELSLRAVLLSGVPVREGCVPQHLNALLRESVPCSVCATPTFVHRSVRVVFKTVGVFYRLPLLFSYCFNCTPASH